MEYQTSAPVKLAQLGFKPEPGTPTLEASSIDHDYHVVPQPSSGRFTIHHPAATDGSWKLRALDGKVVALGGITAGATFTAIQEQGLPAGLYWMELQREDHIAYLRVSISK